MIGVSAKVCEQKWLTAGLVATSLRLYRNEYRLDLLECLGVSRPDNPSFLCSVVLIEDS